MKKQILTSLVILTAWEFAIKPVLTKTLKG